MSSSITAIDPSSKEAQPSATAANIPRSSHESSDQAQNEITKVQVVEEPEWLSGKKWAVVMIGLVITNFLTLLDTAVLATAVPYITDHFHSTADLGWYGAAYMLTFAAVQPLNGKIYSSFKSKPVYLVFVGIFSLGNILCAVAISSNMLIIGRAVTGMGAAGITSGAIIVITQCIPMSRRPTVIGQLMAMVQLGILLGPLIGGALTQHVSWRWIFYIQLPVAAIGAGALVIFGVPERIVKPPASTVVKELPARMDLVGFVLFSSAVTQLLLAMEYGGNNFAWNSSVIIGLFCGFGATLIVWLGWSHYKRDDALIPLSMLARRHIWISVVVIFAFSGGLYGSSYYLPLYFQAIKGKSPTMSGVYLLPSIIAQAFASITSGKLVSVLGYYLPFSVAGGALTSIAYGLFSTFNPSTSTGKWIGYQILAGFGRGLALQMPYLAAQNSVSPREIPTAMSLITFGQMMGGALTLSFADTIFTNSLRELVPVDTEGVNADSIISAGAAGFRSVVTLSQLPGVLTAYSGSIDRVFYLLAALGAVVALFSFGIGWKDVRAKKAPIKT